MEVGDGNTKNFHLAGVIPVAGQPLSFNMPWHDCMMPVGDNYLAIERAAYECASAGCETIWIVVHREMQPLLRHRLGDKIVDPVWTAHSRRFDNFPSDRIKTIPIYYVPIHPKDRDKRDCLSWSVLYGALRCFNVSMNISRWLVPDKYYVTFPYGVQSDTFIRKNLRGKISNKKNFFMRHNGRTVADGEYLPFTFGKEEFIKYRRVIRTGTGKYTKAVWTGETVEAEVLPLEDRWSARNFTLDKVFGVSELDTAEIVDVDWHYNIDNWEDYCVYLGSEERKEIERPTDCLKYSEWNPIGQDVDDDA